MNIQKLRSRILSSILTLALVIGLFAVPMTVSAVGGEGLGSASDIPTSQSGNIPGTEVYFGVDGYNNDTPLLWRVVAKDDDTITLFADSFIYTDDTNNAVQRRFGKGVSWDYSEIRHWLNSEDAKVGQNTYAYSDTGFLTTAFKFAEQAAIGTYGTTEPANAAIPDEDNWISMGPIDISQKIVLPSQVEFENGGTWGFTENSQRKISGTSTYQTCLRSADTTTNMSHMIYVRNSDGYLGRFATMTYDWYNDKYSYFTIRPAFKLNLSSVLFTSAATGGKSGAVGTLSAPESATGDLKFTIKDDMNLGLDVSDTSRRTVISGEQISVPYTGVTYGADKYVSAVIVSANDTAKAPLFYGKLVSAATVAEEDGTATFTVPNEDVIPDGNYTLRIFNEEINGANLTDYASTPVDIPLTVNNHPPDLVNKSALESARSTANKINHGGVNKTTSWTNFENAMKEANKVFGDTAATQKEVDDVTKALVDATLALKHLDISKSFENGVKSHQIGSKDNIVHVIAHDWSLHTGVVKVDGKQIALGKHYTSATGSTRTTLLASYLDTLTPGTHTLTVEYADGTDNISDSFVIVAAEVGDGGNSGGNSGDVDDNNSGSTTNNNGGSSDNTSSGDTSNGGSDNVDNNNGGNGDINNGSGSDNNSSGDTNNGSGNTNNNGGSGEGGSPKTGDDMNYVLLITLCGGALLTVTLLIIWRRKVKAQ